MDILTTSMLSMVGEKNQAYYTELDQEDLAHNMEMLFGELRTLRSMMCENNDALVEFITEISSDKK